MAIARISSPARAFKTHQRIGSILYYNLENEVGDDYWVIHEANSADEDLFSLAPDVTVFDDEEIPLVSFQVCTKLTLRLELKKLERLFDYGTEEVFIFIYKGNFRNYKIVDIKKYTPTGEDTENSNFSDTLNIDINKDLAYLN